LEYYFNNKQLTIIMVERQINTGTTRSEFLQQEAPVLEKIEKVVHKDVYEQPHIIEKHKKDFIEVHEQPTIKKILHPSQEVYVQEQDFVESRGRDTAQLEHDRLLNEMRDRDRSRQVVIEEKQDISVHSVSPTVNVRNEYRTELVQKPVVTEIHEQPITEIHDQNIYRTVYEKPEMTVVRDNNLVEITSTSSKPISLSHTSETLGSGLINLPRDELLQQQQSQTYSGQSSGLYGQQAPLEEIVIEKNKDKQLYTINN
jgi:hypothetical protein